MRPNKKNEPEVALLANRNVITITGKCTHGDCSHTMSITIWMCIWGSNLFFASGAAKRRVVPERPDDSICLCWFRRTERFVTFLSSSCLNEQPKVFTHRLIFLKARFGRPLSIVSTTTTTTTMTIAVCGQCNQIKVITMFSTWTKRMSKDEAYKKPYLGRTLKNEISN